MRRIRGSSFPLNRAKRASMNRPHQQKPRSGAQPANADECRKGASSGIRRFIRRGRESPESADSALQRGRQPIIGEDEFQADRSLPFRVLTSGIWFEFFSECLGHGSGWPGVMVARRDVTLKDGEDEFLNASFFSSFVIL
jgi:hypothetical protein